jgi:translation initiation factor IF-3
LRRAPRRPVAPENEQNELRVNWRIRVPRVLVIDEEGNKLGEFMTEDAIRLAEVRGADLIEVAPTARPPVCKIGDFGKLKYENKKREATARKNQFHQQLKEVKLRPKTDDHDLGVKIRAICRFLEGGNKVKITVRFRGRELAHREIGAEQCVAIAKECGDLCIVESPPRMDGRQMFMILAPTRKPPPRVIKEKRPPLPDGSAAPEEEDDDDDYQKDLHEPDDDDDDDDETGEEPGEPGAGGAPPA